MALRSLFKAAEEYLVSMIAAVQAGGSKLTDFNTGSVTRTFYEGLASGLSEQSAVADQLRQDSYLATATGDALDLKAADYQVTRKAAVKATGTVRITRTGTGLGAVTIPAGWGALATIPAPGVPSLSYVTLADAVFPIFAGPGTQTIDVSGEAVIAGTTGNNSQGAGVETVVLPLSPVAGFITASDFKLRGPWSGGVDAERDADLRARVPLEVQARVKGRKSSFEAAALRVPGVTGAQVLQAGEARSDATLVPAGGVETYFKGLASHLAQVQSEVTAAASAGQNATAFLAASERIIANLTVYALSGVDTAALAIAVRDTVMAVVNAGSVGGTVRYSEAVRAVHELAAVEGVALPFAQFRKSTAAPGTAADIVAAATKYPDLVTGDVTVTVTLI
jgi:uncharacterized phage protein gp47/JayE